MSVVGFDIGTSFSKIAVAHKKKISVVPNDLSKLTTPTLVAFTDNERFFGEAAVSQWARNYRCTIPQIKRLLGRLSNDSTLQQELQDYFLINTASLENGCIGIEVDTSKGSATLSPEQVLAPYLSKLKQFASRYLEGFPIRDCVIACPNYFDDAQRRAILTAAKLADLNVLRLMNESTAIALDYGILRELPQDSARRVIFCDIGEANTQISVVDFVHGKLTMRYVATNAFVGGRNFDLALFKYFSNLWQKQNSTSINESKRATLRLLRECNGVKKILSANRDCVLSLDCFLDDTDFTLRIDRKTAEKEWEPILQEILEPLKEAINEIKKDNIKIHSVEMVGGTSRIPSVQEKILQYMKTVEPDIQSLSWTLNGDESVARGATLMCAMLSPNFKVKQFQVQDINTWPITIEYVSEKGINTEQLAINRLNQSPCTAKVKFYKTQSFDFKLKLPSKVQLDENTSFDVVYPFSTLRDIGTFSVTSVPLSENLISDPKIQVTISLNKHGLVDLPQATLLETVKLVGVTSTEQKAQLPPIDEKLNEAGTTPEKDVMDVDASQQEQQQQNNSVENENEPMDVDNNEKQNETKNQNINPEETSNANNNNNNNNINENKENNVNANVNINAKPEEKKNDKRKIQRNLYVTGKFNNDISNETFNQWYEFEAALWTNDTIIQETYERRNELETYIYNIRNKLESSYKDYINDEEREELTKRLNMNQDWLYGEGEDANKSAYVERLKNLHEITDIFDERYHEGISRPNHIEQLKKLIDKYHTFVDTNNPQYNHITDEEKKQIKENIKKCDEWLTEKIIQQNRIPLYEKPILVTKEINDKYHELISQCQPIINKPKPAEHPKEEKLNDAAANTNVDASASANTNSKSDVHSRADANANIHTNTNTNDNANANENVNASDNTDNKTNKTDINVNQQEPSKLNRDNIAFEDSVDHMQFD